MNDKARIIKQWLDDCGYEYLEIRDSDNQSEIDKFKVFYLTETGDGVEIITEIKMCGEGPIVEVSASIDYAPPLNTPAEPFYRNADGYISSDGLNDDPNEPDLEADDIIDVIALINLADPGCFDDISQVIVDGNNAKVKWHTRDWSQ
jgi:hypothetical protein